MKRIKVILFFITFSIFLNCDPSDGLEMINKSGANLYCFYSCDSTLDDLKIFKNSYYTNSLGDSAFVTSKNYITKDSFQIIPKRGWKAWENYIEVV